MKTLNQYGIFWNTKNEIRQRIRMKIALNIKYSDDITNSNILKVFK